jgi:hypothetical protein
MLLGPLAVRLLEKLQTRGLVTFDSSPIDLARWVGA